MTTKQLAGASAVALGFAGILAVSTMGAPKVGALENDGYNADGSLVTDYEVQSYGKFAYDNDQDGIADILISANDIKAINQNSNAQSAALNNVQSRMDAIQKKVNDSGILKK